MNLIEEIQKAVKSKDIIIGYRKSIRFIKSSKPKFVIVAENSPEKIRKEIEHNAKIFKFRLEIFKGTSKELGTVCGKPFPVTTLVIK